MGIGFKAVYKRFAKVTVYDSRWCFRFEEPMHVSTSEPSHGWVLKPTWIARRQDLWDCEYSSPTAKWCHFQLERARGGVSCSNDLQSLSQSIPALLGRQALENYRHRHKQISEAVSSLLWCDSNYVLCIHSLLSYQINSSEEIAVSQ